MKAFALGTIALMGAPLFALRSAPVPAIAVVALRRALIAVIVANPTRFVPGRLTMPATILVTMLL